MSSNPPSNPQGTCGGPCHSRSEHRYCEASDHLHSPAPQHARSNLHPHCGDPRTHLSTQRIFGAALLPHSAAQFMDDVVYHNTLTAHPRQPTLSHLSAHGQCPSYSPSHLSPQKTLRYILIATGDQNVYKPPRTPRREYTPPPKEKAFSKFYATQSTSP
jgi:hypothetical protein